MKRAITDYIPQRSPMVMIDALLEATDQSATTSLTILPGNIFVDGNYLREPGLIENIAQTAAAMVGYDCMEKNVPVPVGFIAAVKDLKIEALPLVNSTIQTTISVSNTVMNITIVKGRIEQAGRLLCSCEMRILVQQQQTNN